jgi:hypothetical protein
MDDSCEYACVICMTNYENLIKCRVCTSHICNDCYLEYIKSKTFCPICKNEFLDGNIIKNRNITIFYNSELIKKYQIRIMLLGIFCISWTIAWLAFGCHLFNCNYKIYNSTIT